MTTFTPAPNAVHWITEAGPARLSISTALVLSSLFLSEHDDLLKSGDREGARTIRKLWFELEDALGEYGAREKAA